MAQNPHWDANGVLVAAALLMPETLPLASRLIKIVDKMPDDEGEEMAKELLRRAGNSSAL